MKLTVKNIFFLFEKLKHIVYTRDHLDGNFLQFCTVIYIYLKTEGKKTIKMVWNED